MTEKLLSGELDIAFMRLPLPENTVHCPKLLPLSRKHYLSRYRPEL